MDRYISFRGPITSSASVDSTDLEIVVSAGNDISTVVSEGKSVGLSQRSELSVISSGSNTIVPDELVLKSLFIARSRP